MRTSKINPVWAMVPLLMLAVMIGFVLVDSEDVTDVDGGTTKCSTCSGTGKVTCSRCNGNGYITSSYSGDGEKYYRTVGCSSCGGSGYYIEAFDATSYEDGNLVYGSGEVSCSTCGGSGSVHTHTYTSTKKYYTCPGGYVYTYTCSCGDSYTSGTGYSSHSYSSSGGHWDGCDYYTDKTCSNCGKTVSTWSRSSHSYSSSVTTSPTCTSEGVRTYTCSDCGASYTESISPTGHSYSSYSAKSATCTSSGYQAYYYCSKCSTYFTSSKTATTWSSLTISALGHSYGSWSTTKAATCTATGTQSHSCTRCSNTEAQTISALGHSYSASTYSWSSDYSTCTVEFVCSRDSSHTGTATVSSTSTTSGNATTYIVSGTDSTYNASYSQSKTVYTYTATLEYDAGNGSGAPSGQTATTRIESSSASGSNTFTIASDVPAYTGYIFQGWATSSGAESAEYQPGGSISVAYGSSVTLHAVWKAAALEITSEPINKTLKVGQLWTYAPTVNIAGCTLAVTGADWLSVSDGVISGTPDSYGSYDVTITVSKDGGYTSTQQTFQLKVYSVLGFESEPSASGVFAYAS